MNELALKALQEYREKKKELGIKVVVKDPITKSRENPTSLRLAINGKCFDCQGAGNDPGTKDAIRDCEAKDCTLWAVRPYRLR
jgi:hypothetical protein